MTTLIFVRHGQSESNLAMRFTGQTDTVLTALGWQQAENTAKFLERYPIKYIYASDLTRVMQTAEPTAKKIGLEIIPDRALREIYAGEWEGKLYSELRAEFPESYRLWLEDIGRARPDGGESVVELSERIYAEVDRLLKKHRGECIALFSHAIPLRLMGCRWFGYAPQDAASVKGCSNASVSVVEYADDGGFRVLHYGYDAHHGENTTALPTGLV